MATEENQNNVVNEVEKLTSIYGEVKKIFLPSLRWVYIRLQNGEDDDLISNQTLAREFKNFTAFIKAIVIKKGWGDGGALTFEEAQQLPIRDRYYILIASRAFSLGETLLFDFTWPDISKKEPVTYKEDLNNYLHDYSGGDIPQEGEPGYSEWKIPAYKEFSENGMTLTTSSGKELRYKFYNGLSDEISTKMSVKGEMTRNTELLARQLEYNDKGAAGWVRVSNFKMFSARDMAEIRAHVEANDPVVTPLMEVEHPTDPNQVEVVMLHMLEGFLFPREIL